MLWRFWLIILLLAGLNAQAAGILVTAWAIRSEGDYIHREVIGIGLKLDETGANAIQVNTR